MTNPMEPKVPTERPDPAAAAHTPEGGGEDRPGFDLGGAQDPAPGGGRSTIPGGPKGSPASGTTGAGRATGLTDPSGSRSLGNGGTEAGSAAGAGSTDGSGGPS